MSPAPVIECDIILEGSNEMLVTLSLPVVPLGGIGLAFAAAHASTEVGYWMSLPARGHGYATEAASALYDFAFSQLGVHRIEGRYFTRNPASGRVMQTLGMRHEGVMREAVQR
jgi:ribosomal-protein-alanine N-acetyltransferase